jgi:hypothetical protein
LEVQGHLVNIVTDILPASQITKWSKSIELLSATLFCFCRKALQQQLPTSSNLHRWGKSGDPLCSLCQKPQTNKHVLNNCASPVVLERYKIRHDAVLLILCGWLKQTISAIASLHADIKSEDCRQVEDIFQRLRPDIVVVYPGKLIILELTICHESNFDQSKKYKINKYCNLKGDLKAEYSDFKLEVFTIEISSLGLMPDINGFIKQISTSMLPLHVYNNIVKSVVSNSYNIYRNRNKQ